MGKEIMCASIITAIILCIVGIIKVLPPCLSFKEKHPKWYKGIFYGVSLILAVAFPILGELYILNGSLASVNFIVLIFTTIAGVFGLYTSYEGLGLKELAKKLVEKIAELLNNFKESKAAKLVKEMGLDKLSEIDTKNKEKEAKKLADEEAKRLAKEAKQKEKEAKKLEKAKEIVAQSENTAVVTPNVNETVPNTIQTPNVATQSTQVNPTPVNQATPTNTPNVF